MRLRANDLAVLGVGARLRLLDGSFAGPLLQDDLPECAARLLRCNSLFLPAGTLI